MESWAHLFTSKKDKFISCESTIAAEFRKQLSLLSGLKAFFYRYIRIFVTFAVHYIYIANKQTNKQASKQKNKASFFNLWGIYFRGVVSFGNLR